MAEGRFTDLTKSLNENRDWRNIYGNFSPRAKDQELITRVLALLRKGDNYERPMATFLTKFVREMNAASPEELARLRKTFEPTAELSWNALGKTGFRPVRALNAAVLDSVMSELARRLRNRDEKPSPGSIKQAYDTLIQSEGFREGWSSRTSNETVVKKRIAAARNAFASI